MTGEIQGLPVTVVTADAGQDRLGEQDYREIYDEVRALDEATGKYGVSLDAFVELVHSEYSKAAWSKYHRAELELNRTMRNELRGAVGMALLPLTIAEATAGVDADATVVQVGGDTVRRVVMLGVNDAVTVHWNGTVSAWTGCQGDKVTGDAGSHRVTGVTRDRKAVFVPARLFDRVNALRRESGLSWGEVLEAAEAALAAKADSSLRPE